MQYSTQQKAFIAQWSTLDCMEPGVYHDTHIPQRRYGRTEAVIQCITQMLSREPNLTIVFYTPRRDAPERFESRIPQYGDRVHVRVYGDPQLNDLLQYEERADVTIIHHLPRRPCPYGGRILYVGV